MKIILKPMGVALLGIIVAVLICLISGMGKAYIANTAPVQRVYTDAEDNGWELRQWTWAKDVDFANHEQAHSGTTSIRVRFRDFDGVKFHHAQPYFSRYDRLAFAVNGGKEGGQEIYVGGVLTQDRALGKVTLEKIPANQWRVVVIPLKDLLPANARLDEIESWWIGGNRNGIQPALYLDDIQLLPPGAPVPGGTPLGSTVSP